jgi:hypothetical protein
MTFGAGASSLATPWKRIAKIARRRENEMNRMTMKKFLLWLTFV